MQEDTEVIEFLSHLEAAASKDDLPEIPSLGVVVVLLEMMGSAELTTARALIAARMTHTVKEIAAVSGLPATTVQRWTETGPPAIHALDRARRRREEAS